MSPDRSDERHAERCHELERWLETADPGAAPEWVRDHARACPRCATRLARARELDQWLADTLPVAAPPGFTGAVLARIAAEPVPARMALPPWRDPMPLVAQIAMEPAVMLALALAALCLWQGGRLRALALVLVSASARAGHGTPAVQPWALALGLAPLAGIATVWLYHWAARIGAHAGRPRAARP